MLRLFSRDLLRYLPAQVVPAFLGFVSVPLITRLLSAEQYGQYALVMSSLYILVRLLSWIDSALVRFYEAVPEQDVTVLIRTAFWTKFVTACALGAVVCLLTYTVWMPGSAFQPLIAIGVLIFIIQSTFEILTQVLRVRLQAGAYSLYTIWTRSVSLGLGILFVSIWQLGGGGLLWGMALGITTSLPFLWRKAFAGVKVIGPISWTLLCESAQYGIPLVIVSLGGLMLQYFDRYLIQLFYSAREVGIYSAAYMISHHSIILLGTVFRLSSVPLLVNTWEKRGQEETRHFLRSVTRLYLLVSIPMVAGMSMLAQPAMKIVVGPEFSDGYIIVPWIAAGVFFLSLQHRFNHVLLLCKKTKIIMLSMIICSLLNIYLNWTLLPILGYEIAALNTLISYIVLCITMAIISRRHFYWPFPWLTAMRCLLCAIFMCVFLFFIDKIDISPLWLLSIAVPIGMIIYTLGIYISGEISLEEQKTLLGIIKKQLFPQKSARF